MANIIEIILKGVDKTKDALTKPVKDAADLKKKLEDLVPAFEFVGAAAAGVFVKMSKDFADTAGEAAKLSKTFGETIDTTSAFLAAAKRGSIGSEEFGKSVKELSKSMVEAASGENATTSFYRQLGIDVLNTDGTLKSSKEVMLEVADVFHNSADGAEKTAAAVKLFGRAGADMIPFLNKGRDGIEELTARARELGVTVSTETAAQLKAFKDQGKDLNEELEGMAGQVVTAVLPVFLKLQEELLGSSDKAYIFKAAAQTIIDILKGLGGAIIWVRGAFQFWGTVLGTVAYILYELGADGIQPFIALGRALGENVYSVVQAFIDLGTAAGKVAEIFGNLVHGNFSAAWQSSKEMALQMKDAVVKAGSTIASSWEKNAGDVNQRWTTSMAGIRSATAAMSKDVTAIADHTADALAKILDPSVKPNIPQQPKTGNAKIQIIDTAQAEKTYQKVKELYADMIASMEGGNDRLMAAEDLRYEKRLQEILELKISEDERLDLNQAAEAEHAAKVTQIRQTEANKAAEISAQMYAEMQEGGDKLFADEQSKFEKRIAQINDLKVSEEQKAALRLQAEQSLQTAISKIVHDHLAQRRDLETAYNNGSIADSMKLLRAGYSAFEADLQGRQQLISTYEQMAKQSYFSIFSFASTMAQSFHQGLSSAISGLIQGTMTFTQAIQELGQALLKSVADYIANWIAAKLTALALELVYGHTVAATSAATAASVAASWAPAAALASLASFGANSIPAGVALITTAGIADGIAATAFIGGQAHSGLDFVPSESTFLLQRGERVVQPEQNRDLTSFLSNPDRGGGVPDSGTAQVNIYLDGDILGRGIGRLSRDGRLNISARAVT